MYLNGLDQLVKHQLKCRHYIRYCDDFVLLSPERDELLAWRDQIETYLRGALVLELNPRERLRPISDGIDFLGYIVRRNYRLVRRRVVNACKARLRVYRELLVLEHEGATTYRVSTRRIWTDCGRPCRPISADPGRRAGRPDDHLRRSPDLADGALQVRADYIQANDGHPVLTFTAGTLAVHKQGRSMPEIPVAIFGKGVRKPSAFAAMRSGPL